MGSSGATTCRRGLFTKYIPSFLLTEGLQVIAAAKRAQEEYKRAHPEINEADLKVDLPKAPPKQGPVCNNPNHHHHHHHFPPPMPNNIGMGLPMDLPLPRHMLHPPAPLIIGADGMPRRAQFPHEAVHGLDDLPLFRRVVQLPELHLPPGPALPPLPAPERRRYPTRARGPPPAPVPAPAPAAPPALDPARLEAALREQLIQEHLALREMARARPARAVRLARQQ